MNGKLKAVNELPPLVVLVISITGVIAPELMVSARPQTVLASGVAMSHKPRPGVVNAVDCEVHCAFADNVSVKLNAIRYRYFFIVF